MKRHEPSLEIPAQKSHCPAGQERRERLLVAQGDHEVDVAGPASRKAL
jgi:hypothetical protein